MLSWSRRWWTLGRTKENETEKNIAYQNDLLTRFEKLRPVLLARGIKTEKGAFNHVFRTGLDATEAELKAKEKAPGE